MMSKEKAGLFLKMSKVMEEVSRVKKNGYNKHNNYSYVTESDLTDEIRPLLAKQKLAFFSTVEDQIREGDFTKVKMKFIIADGDTGETFESIYWGEGQDKQDKGLYKAYTGATKYWLMKTFLMATGDDPEAELEYSNKSNENPMSEKQLNYLLRNLSKIGMSEEEVKELNSKEASAIISKLTADKTSNQSNNSQAPSSQPSTSQEKTETNESSEVKEELAKEGDVRYVHTLIKLVSKKEKKDLSAIEKELKTKFEVAEILAGDISKGAVQNMIQVLKGRLTA